jgi:hypothetical protein
LYTGLICSFVAFSLNGCGTVDSAYRSTKTGLAALTPDMAAWHGHSFDELVESWGEPSAQLELGESLMVYTWTRQGSDCQQTFTVRSDRIVGSSDTNCTD